ncbi:unnamed protein product [Diabrotica balteata]|uniref:Ionotropic receptor n=1 Tax=Diabrotica balteata TaxID=107213 RepID=A0A9N9XBG4_DIABA|nr:unnamed protein product [Diabrotica balteata]
MRRIDRQANPQNVPRPIILEMKKEATRMEILKAAKNLRGTKIYVNEDFPKKTLQERKHLLQHIKMVRQEGHIAALKYNKLRINGEPFSRKQLEGIDVNYWKKPEEKKVFTTCYKSKMFDIMRVNNSYNIIETPFDLLKYKIDIGLLLPVVNKQYTQYTDPTEQKLIESNVNVYCVFTTGYKSKMFGIMRVNNSYNVIETPFDLLKYKIDIGLLLPAVNKRYTQNTDPTERKLIESNVNVYCEQSVEKMLLLFLLSSGILLTEAYISVKSNLNILEGCLNELFDFINEEKKFIYVVNANIPIKNYPTVSFNRISEIKKIPPIFPNVYLVSINVSEVLSVLYKLKILNNLKYYILIVQNIDETIMKSLEHYFISKILFITLNTNIDYYEIYMMKSTGHELIHMCPNQKENWPAINKLRTKIIKKYDYLNVLYSIDEPYVISTTQGIHIELLSIIAENINVKLNFIKSRERPTILEITPEFISNWTYDLYAALFSSRLSTQSHSFDESIRITEDKLIFITPNILITNNWAIFYGEFANSVWAYFALLLLILSVIISLIDYLVPEHRYTNILSFLLSVLFEGTFTLYSKQRAVKIIFINYLIFVLIFTTVYKSQMFDIIRKDNAYNPIKRQIDMLKFKFKICLPSKVLFDSYKTSKDPIEHYFGWNSDVIVNPDYWQCVNMIAYEKNTVALILSKRLEYVGPEVYLDENGFPLLNILLKDFHTYLYFVFAFRKGHPLFNIFNRKLTTLKETGFVEYQYKIYKRQFEKAVAVSQKKKSFYFKPLKLNSLQSVFFVYIALIIVSSLVFGFELVLVRHVR